MWTSIAFGLFGISLLIIPPLRRMHTFLAIACGSVFLSTWVDKGVGLVIGGFIPNPLEQITEYYPTFPEIAIATAIWAIGALILTILYKLVISVREQNA
jgi:molybdopterin-containing oxidoreductase family membrane subunit